MWVYLLPVLAAAIMASIGVALFIVLPVKWALVAAIVCIMAIGGILAVTDVPFR